jgi:hypothetical protein
VDVLLHQYLVSTRGLGFNVRLRSLDILRFAREERRTGLHQQLSMSVRRQNRQQVLDGVCRFILHSVKASVVLGLDTKDYAGKDKRLRYPCRPSIQSPSVYNIGAVLSPDILCVFSAADSTVFQEELWPQLSHFCLDFSPTLTPLLLTLSMCCD